eukprot:COSAG06_NODE_33747_length_485_cov_0.455959_1_plen_27_part_10
MFLQEAMTLLIDTANIAVANDANGVDI